MPQEIQNKAEYIVIFISEFARHFGLSALQAYRYLNRYKAIDFLDEHYNIAHTQSFEDMVQNMAGYCQRHGGELSMGLSQTIRSEHKSVMSLRGTSIWTPFSKG